MKSHICYLIALSLALAPTWSPVAQAQDDEVFMESDDLLEDEGDLFLEESAMGDMGDDEFSNFEEEDMEEMFSESDSEGEEASFDDFEDFDGMGEGGGEPQMVQEPVPGEEGFELEPLGPDEQEFVDEPLQPAIPDAAPPPAMEAEQAPPPAPAPEEPPAFEQPAFEDPVAQPDTMPPTQPVADVADEPDYALESRLHDIYVNYHSVKTPEEQWQALVGPRESENYAIQSGDTLWGISETFFSDGNYWPKIWAVNNTITNPHLIQPGNSIRFLLGDESNAPAFTVTETTEEVDTSLAGSEAEPYQPVGSGSDVEIPPPTFESRPVVSRLPPSLPEWQNENTSGEYDDVGIAYGRRPILDIRNDISLNGFIEPKPIEGVGHVAEMEAWSETASDFQYIYVKVRKGSGRSGQKYIVVRNLGPLKAPNSEVEGDLGHYVQVQGQIQLSDVVQSNSDQDEFDLFRALVLKTVNPITVESSLLEEPLPMVSLNDDGPRSQVVAQIIGGYFDNRKQMYGQGSVVFLNRGSSDGLSVGQVLPVRSNVQVRNPDSILAENVRPIGYIKVARVTGDYATAVVLNSWEEIRTGDLTGQGSLMVRPQAALDGDGGDMDFGDGGSEPESLEGLEEESFEDIDF